MCDAWNLLGRHEINLPGSRDRAQKDHPLSLVYIQKVNGESGTDASCPESPSKRKGERIKEKNRSGEQGAKIGARPLMEEGVHRPSLEKEQAFAHLNVSGL